MFKLPTADSESLQPSINMDEVSTTSLKHASGKHEAVHHQKLEEASLRNPLLQTPEKFEALPSEQEPITPPPATHTGTPKPNPSKNPCPRFGWLHCWQPLLLASLSLHGVLLFMPIPETPPPQIDHLPQPEEPLETIALRDLLAPPPKVVPHPPPENALPTTPLPADGSAESTPSGSPPVIPTPASDPPVPPPASSPPIPEAEISAAAVAPINQPETAPDTAQSFLDQLSATTEVPVNVPAPELFSDPLLFFEPVEPASTLPSTMLKANILKAVWMDGKTPEQVYISVLSSQLQSGNFQTIQKPDFGGGTVYEIVQGESVWYLNLVPTIDGAGSIIVIWNQDPSHLNE